MQFNICKKSTKYPATNFHTMKKRFIIVFTLTLVLSFFSLMAQTHMERKNQPRLNYRSFLTPGPQVELGLYVGAANAMTDIGASSYQQQASMFDVYSRGMSPSVAVYTRYKPNERLGLRANLSASMIRGNDRWSPEIEVVNRGKSFTNNIYELAVVGEYYLPKGFKKPKQDFRFNWLDFYVFAGAAGFYHDPMVFGPIIDEYDRKLLESDDVVKNFQFAIPMGLGLKWNIASEWTIGLDFNFRYTFFDYLDGFRRPYSDRNDFYFTTGISIGYIFENNSRNTNRMITRKVFSGKGNKTPPIRN